MAEERKTERSGPVVMRDERGNEYRVYVEQTFLRSSYLDGTKSEWEELLKRFFTPDSPVNKLEDGWFEVVSTGTRIRP